ncbi:MAG: DUF983 domain-containing protein [Saprospiraceae bacterium]|jgi:uncharacterized protein (DUF983 family)|nr:DUF983 domain-containing protein [Saprospiraceae bacterium]MBK7797257.1 DUF983 domain-containing protein [Saprospiraceae bacterium]MBK9377744.1 DUF983 domain-containing protein [Saprospiraceae bacterium]MBL0261648.1 DUF983 domain-containing protein [Saprospiraceae bacterium]MBX7163091.1 DUF983 domain-containing protein [Saprospiraceae bacterium]
MPNWIQSVLGMKCPACRKGSLFPNNKLFDYSFTMNERCGVCNEEFFREPGFYYGAMFLSYIISAFFSLIFVGTLILVFHMDWVLAVGLLALTLAVFFVFLFRLARSLWIHILVKYKPKERRA